MPANSPHIFSVAEDNNQSHDGKNPSENKVIASSKKWMAGNTAKVISPTTAAVTLENEIMLVR